VSNERTQLWVLGFAIIGVATLIGCEGSSFDVPVNIGNPEIDIETGDVTTTVETNVSQVQNVRIGDNIMIQGGNTIAAAPQPTLTPAEAEEIVIPEEIPECIPVEEITEDQLIAVCIPLRGDFNIDSLEFVYVQFEGLDGATQIPAAELDFRNDMVCFDIEFIGELGASEDPIAALGGLEGVGNALDCIYQLETPLGVTPEYTTLVVQEGDDCGLDNELDDDFREVIPG